MGGNLALASTPQPASTTHRKPFYWKLKPGDDCGPYEIAGVLGRGGYGTVYRALHLETGEPVALKVVLHRFTEDKRAGIRLLREADALRRVNHCNVVGYRDAELFPDGEGAWLAMELVQGRTLGQLLRSDGRLPLRAALTIGAQLCDGLTQIHQVPLVHRDIKPDNIMLTDRGTVKIIDLGIVRTRKGSGTTRQVGSGYYTAPDYLRLSPTQLEAALDPRWDIFSAGVVLWEALAGHHPLRPHGHDISLGGILARYIQDGRLPLLSVSGLPTEVRDVVAKAVTLDANDRWQSAGEFGAAIQRCLRQCTPEPRLTRPPSSAPYEQTASPQLPADEAVTRPLDTEQLAQIQHSLGSAATTPLAVNNLITAATTPISAGTDNLGVSNATAPLLSRTNPLEPPQPAAPQYTAPLDVQRALVEAYEAATAHLANEQKPRQARLGDERLRQAQQERLENQTRIVSQTEPSLPPSQMQPSQHRYEIALTVLITTGSIAILIILLKLLGVI